MHDAKHIYVASKITKTWMNKLNRPLSLMIIYVTD